jgi:exodeoxyribonuclease-3
MANLTVATVNVNGLRAAVKKGMGKWFESQRKKGLNVLCLQETKISEDKDKEDFINICNELDIKDLYLQDDKYNPGYGGVAVWVDLETCKLLQPIEYPFEANMAEAKDLGFSGRWQEILIKFNNKEVMIVNSYYHSAKSPFYKEKGVFICREQSKELMDNKHKFFIKTTQRMRELITIKKYNNFILVGDINTAHYERIDIRNFKGNEKMAGFLPEERAWLDLWFDKTGEKYVKSTYNEGKTAMDVYRENLKIKYVPPLTDEFEKEGLGLWDVVREKLGKNMEQGTEKYSMWSWRGQQFTRNAGRRIDYQIATKSLAKCVLKAEIQKQESYEQRWSDHAPVVVTYSM